MGVRQDRAGYLLSGVSAQKTGSAIDMRASNGHFMRFYSASADGPSANGSAIYDLLHSHDLTAWTVLERVTAVEAAIGTAHFSAGAYAYLMASASLLYSAAETGTAALWLHITPGIP